MSACKPFCILLMLLLSALFLHIVIYFNSTISIYKPIPGAIILKNLIKNASDLKVIPIPFHVNLSAPSVSVTIKRKC